LRRIYFLRCRRFGIEAVASDKWLGRETTAPQAVVPGREQRPACDIFFGLMAKTKKKNGKKTAAASGKSASGPARAARGTAAAGGARKSAGGLAFGRGANPARVRAILQGLDEAYPEASCELIHDNPFELLISTILSAQCTDAVVNIVTKDLFQKYPDAKALAYADPRALEQEIRPTGFFRNKTKSIMGASKKILEEFGGKVPQTMDELLTLPGVARKTANVVLGSGFGIASGVVVDTHVQRLSERLDLTKNTDPKKIEQDLMQIITREKWILFSHQLIWHGRRVCNARKPKCIECNIEKLCYSKDKTI
jgi:endonuclease-3